MDVDQTQFLPNLLAILRSISAASFVSFDLEMSGINDRVRDNAKCSLEKHYEETKSAVEKYQVLQVGITCVREDREQEAYIATAYNINVSPLFHSDKLRLHRDITFSSSALYFLQSHSFDIGAVFRSGVSYLSHNEQELARLRYKEWQNRDSEPKPDTIIPPEETETLAFMQKTRATISEWVNEKSDVKLAFVNIGVPGGLNGYQRKLIHELIRREFPKHRVFARGNKEFMQVEKIDPERELRYEKHRLEMLEGDLARQKGVNYIFEALTGGDLSGIDPIWFCSLQKNGKPSAPELAAKKKELDEIQHNLRHDPPIIVGHNLFMDLMFIHKIFTGVLPTDLEDFKIKTHMLFPFLVDTKYMATHMEDAMANSSSLKEVYEVLKDQPRPFVDLDANSVAYKSSDKHHEAGFDSWMTAQIFARISSKLRNEHRRASSENEVSSEENYISAQESLSSDSESEKGAPLDPLRSGGDNISKTSSQRKSNNSTYHAESITPTKKRPETPPPPVSRFSTYNAFSSLASLPADENSSYKISPQSSPETESSTGGVRLSPLNMSPVKFRPTSTHSETRSLLDDDLDDALQSASLRPAIQPTTADRHTRKLTALPPNLGSGGSRPKKSNKERKHETDKQQWIPSKDSSFWKPYANKLRVFGTEGAICDLNI